MGDVPKEECTKQQLGKRDGVQISRMLPPGWNSEAVGLLSTAISCGPSNIQQNVENALREFLQWNLGPNSHHLREQEIKMTRWLQLYLDKANAARVERDLTHSAGNPDTIEPDPKGQRKEGDARSSDPTTRERMMRRGGTPRPISPGVLRAISVVSGELNPQLLLNFLDHARGRKKPEEVAKHFTSNTPALVDQLKGLVTAYYRSGKRGAHEERDVKRIIHLYEKLEQKSTAQEGFLKILPNEVKIEYNDTD